MEQSLSINQEHPVLVLYYSPRCGACIQMKPQWDVLNEVVSTNRLPLNVIQCNATNNAKITQYPTIELTVCGQTSRYEGPRDALSMIQWVRDQSAKCGF